MLAHYVLLWPKRLSSIRHGHIPFSFWQAINWNFMRMAISFYTDFFWICDLNNAVTGYFSNASFPKVSSAIFINNIFLSLNIYFRLAMIHPCVITEYCQCTLLCLELSAYVKISQQTTIYALKRQVKYLLDRLIILLKHITNCMKCNEINKYYFKNTNSYYQDPNSEILPHHE